MREWRPSTDDTPPATIVSLALVAVGVIAGAVLFGAGFGAASASDAILEPDGPCGDGTAASQAALNDSVTAYFDRQLERQRRRLNAIANRSENLSTDRVSITPTVSSIRPSNVSSLYNVTVRVRGTIPSQKGGGTETVTHHRSVFVSCDGRYLFQEPIRLPETNRTAQP